MTQLNTPHSKTQVGMQTASPASDRKLMVISPYTRSLGGMTVSLAHTVEGFRQLGMGEQIRVLTRAGSLQESYLVSAGLGDCLERIVPDPKVKGSFFRKAWQWVHKQPHHWPVLMENCVSRNHLPTLIRQSFRVHLHRRPIFHFFHDLGISYRPLGNGLRRLAFTCLSPKTICNSQFTANSIRKHFSLDAEEVLYQPVDFDRFHPRQDLQPPKVLEPFLDPEIPILLTPSRLNQPGIVNDKNLRALMPVLAALKAQGKRFRSIIVGEDGSNDGRYKRDLLEVANHYGIRDCVTILPPVFDIEHYYPFADAVVTLAPREPFGRTVVEAIACGVPVIGSNTGGIAEILNNFAPEWTVSPNDPESVAHRIATLRAKPNDLEQRLELGRKWVSQHCQVTDYARSIMALVGLSPRSPTAIAGSSSTDPVREKPTPPSHSSFSAPLSPD